MVFLKFLGLLDIITAFIILLTGLGAKFIPLRVIIIFTIYLWVKSLSFRGSMTSVLDGLIGIYLILTPLFTIKPLAIIIFIHLLSKGLASISA